MLLQAFYFSSLSSPAVIRTVSASGLPNTAGIIQTLTFTSHDPTYLSFGGFLVPFALAQDSFGNVYVSDSSANAIYKIDPLLNVTCVVPPSFFQPLEGPGFLACDSAGNLYFSGLTVIYRLAVSGGLPTVIAGVQGDHHRNLNSGPATSITIWPAGQGVAVDAAGNVYFMDSFPVLRRIDPTGFMSIVVGGTPAGFGGTGTLGGPATAWSMVPPTPLIACDPAGNLYIAASNETRVVAVNMQGSPQTLCGISIAAGCVQLVAGMLGVNSFSGDGGPATSAGLFDLGVGTPPTGMAVDSAGNLYLSNGARVRVVDAVTGIINTYAGTGTAGETGDGGIATSAEIDFPRGFAFATPLPPVGPSISERRFSCNGVFESSSAYGDVLKSLALSMAGFVVPPADCWRIYAGSFVPPEVTLADADCRASIKGDFRLSARDTCNGVKGQYIPAFLPINPLGPLAASPASPAWKKTDFPPVQRANYIAEDGGEILWKEIQLDFTNSLWMAQRIARIILERLRRQVTISLPAKLTGLALLAADTMQFLHPRWATVTPPVPTVFQLAHTTLRMESQADGVPAFGTDLLLRETDAAVYEFAQPTSPTAFGDYSPYGQTGIGAGNVE